MNESKTDFKAELALSELKQMQKPKHHQLSFESGYNSALSDIANLIIEKSIETVKIMPVNIITLMSNKFHFLGLSFPVTPKKTIFSYLFSFVKWLFYLK